MTLGQFRDIAVVLLAIEAFVIMLIPLAAAYLAVYGLRRLLPRLRLWMGMVQGWARQGQAWVEAAMKLLLSPILALSALRAGLRQGAATLRRR